ncbi:MAG: hypothetical protein KZQ86_19030 [Candidatus Thiodiazotropha sp. (ex Lucinoma kastoroae)]|nr:hypothetical protein [Candidatus Thiodiazotropha sp. (ex Lucinoma kastoroae)]
MDFQFDQFVLFIVCLIGIAVFFAYSIRAVRRADFTRYLSGLLFAIKATIAAMSKLVMGFIGLLVAGADTSEEEEESDVSAGAFRGGTLNYRTGKLDDGTDPYGWYEKD